MTPPILLTVPLSLLHFTFLGMAMSELEPLRAFGRD